jgi:hypothetical protein
MMVAHVASDAFVGTVAKDFLAYVQVKEKVVG